MKPHRFPRAPRGLSLSLSFLLLAASSTFAVDDAAVPLEFSVRSVGSGPWSSPLTWAPPRVPAAGDRVLISRGTTVVFDVEEKSVMRLVQVVGTLTFRRDRSTELNVALLKIEDSEHCSESGFACDFHDRPGGEPAVTRPALLVGEPGLPIPAEHTARIRLHWLEGLAKDDAPAIACCGGRMELHGSPLSPTWTKLARTAEKGATKVLLRQAPGGWRVGDEIIVTGSSRADGFGSFRPGSRREVQPETEPRTITSIDGKELTLDRPLEFEHSGDGEFRSEVANLSRNVIVESADPDGVRGHTVYHRFSRGSVSHARFAHLGKEGVLGRYAVHFHLVGDTMRGSSIVGAAIVDSHNRWITIHGTEYLVVRDCVGYRSVGHGFFLEDGTEVYNLLEGNLGVHAYEGRRLPDQVLSFDENDGAAFWWANGRNTLVHNVGCESDQYGFRYDMQRTSRFDSRLAVRSASGERERVDVRTIPIWRFEGNEAHGSFAGMVVAANGVRQPDSAIRDEKFLEHIRSIDWTGPDVRHPHRIRDFKIWSSHYALRPQSPSMRIEGLRIHDAAYGIYRPAFENHEYVDLHISNVGAEPFNRGMDDASAQGGSISVDGLIFETGYGNRSTPLVQISDNNLSGRAESHFRRVEVRRPEQFSDRWPLFNRGVGPRVPPMTDRGVPIYVHDHFGPGRHAEVVSTAARDHAPDDATLRELPPFAGDEARVREIDSLEWPRLLDLVDDQPPATMVLKVTRGPEGVCRVRGVSHDDGEIVRVEVAGVDVGGVEARVLSRRAGVVDWEAEIPTPASGELSAFATDAAGHREVTAHTVRVP